MEGSGLPTCPDSHEDLIREQEMELMMQVFLISVTYHFKTPIWSVGYQNNKNILSVRLPYVVLGIKITKHPKCFAFIMLYKYEYQINLSVKPNFKC